MRFIHHRGPTMNKQERLSPAGAEIVEALTEFYETLKQGPEAIAKRFAVRTVDLDLKLPVDTGDEGDRPGGGSSDAKGV